VTGVWLGIETTSAEGGVALVDGSGTIAETMLSVRATHSEKVLPAVAAIFRAAGIDPPGLAGIGVSIGPGSYTGLRIGIATASGLSAGLGVRVKGVETLRVIASATGPSEPVLACTRARKGEVYAALYPSGGALVEPLVPPGVYTAGSLMRMLGDGFPGVLATGSGRSELQDAPVRWLPPAYDGPRPSVVARLASEAASAEGYDTVLEPGYLREWNQEARSV
jgi:tRNA threonylcarbamoyladenosine biosynthesis protein TsaB